MLEDKSLKNPLLTGVENPRRTAILVITSDRGLAGGYNANALKRANTLAAELESDGREVVRYVIGRKGVSFYNFRHIEMAGSWTGFSEQPTFADIRELTEQIGFALQATSEGESNDAPGVDELYIVYTQFTNSVTQTAVSQQLAPVKDAVDDSDLGDSDDDDASGDDATRTAGCPSSTSSSRTASGCSRRCCRATSARASSPRCSSRRRPSRRRGGAR